MTLIDGLLAWKKSQSLQTSVVCIACVWGSWITHCPKAMQPSMHPSFRQSEGPDRWTYSLVEGASAAHPWITTTSQIDANEAGQEQTKTLTAHLIMMHIYNDLYVIETCVVSSMMYIIFILNTCDIPWFGKRPHPHLPSSTDTQSWYPNHDGSSH